MPKENSDETIRFLELISEVEPSAESTHRALKSVRQTLEHQQSKVLKQNIWRIIMNSKMTKFAAAAVIIVVVLFGINQFGVSLDGASVAWADIAKRFESVPFFKLTIYLSYDNSTEAKKIEIWKSEDSQVRAHEGNKVIFANFAEGQNTIVALDRSTKQSVSTYGYARMMLMELCREKQFSLDTITNSWSSTVEEITPVEADDTIVSKETVVFEVKSEETPERLTIWALRDSKLPIRVCFRDPRNKEFGDFVFDYSQQKDAKFFDPDAFTNESHEQPTQPPSENVFNEREVIDVFRKWTVLSGGLFPSSLDIEAIKDIDPKADTSFLYNGLDDKQGAIHFETPYATLSRDNPQSQEEIDKYFNSVLFVLMGGVQRSMAEMTDWYYAGKSVKLGEADKAVLWYKPEDSKTYRVIYGDLSVKDVSQQDLPK